MNDTKMTPNTKVQTSEEALDIQQENLDEQPSRMLEDKAIDKMWSFYLRKSERIDKEMTDSWKGDTDGILIFTGLFSATVAAFIIDNYKSLQPDTGAATVLLLTQISAQLNGTALPIPSDALSQFSTPTGPYLRVNVLWVLSLCLSITCALFAILVQQWARQHLRLSQRRQDIPGLQARIHAYLTKSISVSGVSTFVLMIPSLLQVSVFLFFVGLVELYFTINVTVAYAALAFVIVFASVFLIMTAMPIINRYSPYNTPLSLPLWWMISKVSYMVITFTRLVRASASCLRLVRMSCGRSSSFRQLWLEAWDYSYFTSPLRRFFLPRTLDIERSVLSSPWSRIECDSLVWTLVGFDLSAADVKDVFQGLRVMLRRHASRAESGKISHAPVAQFLLSEHPVRSALTSLCEQPGPDEDNGIRICMGLVWEFAGCFVTPSYEAVEIFPLPPTDCKRIALMGALDTLRSDPSAPTSVVAHCWLALELGDISPSTNVLLEITRFYRLPKSLHGYDLADDPEILRRDGFLLNVISLIDGVLPHVQLNRHCVTSLFLLCGVLLRLIHWERYFREGYQVPPSGMLIEELVRQRARLLHMASMHESLLGSRTRAAARKKALRVQFRILGDVLLQIEKWVQKPPHTVSFVVVPLVRDSEHGRPALDLGESPPF